MVYSGDQDSVIPLLGTQSLVHGLAKDLGLNTTESYRNWFKDQKIAGWTQVYGGFLTFATIRGAGHSAPFLQPKTSLELLEYFLEAKLLPNILYIINTICNTSLIDFFKCNTKFYPLKISIVLLTIYNINENVVKLNIKKLSFLDYISTAKQLQRSILRRH